ncbi:hypothetical protein B0H14DRAFT_3582405 [Mycena olivaceomarginata]|nr:hypothetical protein B0H14DRAFT_3582405 [Mycena olivaceomarginata]
MAYPTSRYQACDPQENLSSQTSSQYPLSMPHLGHYDSAPYRPTRGAESYRSSDDFARKKAVRHQRIKAEQRRRDELRVAYSRLQDALPSSEHRSKLSLLQRGIVPGRLDDIHSAMELYS